MFVVSPSTQKNPTDKITTKISDKNIISLILMVQILSVEILYYPHQEKAVLRNAMEEFFLNIFQSSKLIVSHVFLYINDG